MFLLIGKILSLSFVNITMEIMSLLHYLLNKETMSPSAMGTRSYEVESLNVHDHQDHLEILRSFDINFLRFWEGSFTSFKRKIEMKKSNINKSFILTMPMEICISSAQVKLLYPYSPAIQ